MKRFLLLALAIVMGAGFAFAQTGEMKEHSNNCIWGDRAGYLNVGFVTQWVIEDLSFSNINDVVMKSDLGVSLTSGKNGNRNFMSFCSRQNKDYIFRRFFQCF